MNWLQLRIATTREQTQSLEDALLAAGAVSITMQDNADQPILEPGVGETPLWQQTLITGLFPAATDTNATTQAVTATFGKVLPSARWEILEDKDWERAWMDNFKPMKFGNNLWICPSWLTPPDPAAANLMLDPGLAFGTGTHPTTALCLQWLDSQSLEGCTMVDYGCGSGILGIAALLLGADQVVAIDNDPQALLATIDNTERNNLSRARITTYLPAEFKQDLQADFVVANILAGPLISLAPLISGLCRSGGRLALSGILSSQAQELSACYSQWFDIETPLIKDDWVRISGIKR